MTKKQEKERVLDEKVIKGKKMQNALKSAVRDLLKRDSGATREEIIATLGVTDRTARNLVAQIGREEPVILLEGGGYKLVDPNNISDKDYATLEHSYASLISRSREIVKRASILQMAIKRVAINRTFKDKEVK